MRRAFDDSGKHEQPDAALVRAFARAFETKDISAFAEILRHDTMVVADGGGVAATADPVRGIGDAVRVLLQVMATIPGTACSVQSVNGGLGVVARRDGAVVAVIALDADRTHVYAVWLVLNPRKLELWNGVRPAR